MKKRKTVKATSAADILGMSITISVKNKSPLCCICNKVIPQERVKALNVPLEHLTCVSCSTEKPHKGIYMGEYGTSEMKVVDKVYQDSVRDVFRRSAQEVEEEMGTADEASESEIPFGT